jgi:hypothetical protein
MSSQAMDHSGGGIRGKDVLHFITQYCAMMPKVGTRLLQGSGVGTRTCASKDAKLKLLFGHRPMETEGSGKIIRAKSMSTKVERMR